MMFKGPRDEAAGAARGTGGRRARGEPLVAAAHRIDPAARRNVRSPAPSAVRVGAHGRPGTLLLLPGAHGLVIWAAAGRPADAPDRTSPSAREADLAQVLARRGLATLFLDLLDANLPAPAPVSAHLGATLAPQRQAQGPDPTASLTLLAARAVDALDWAAGQAELAGLRAGLCAGGVAAAAALLATTQRPARVAAVVACSGRPDLAGPALMRVSAPTLLIVGGNDAATVQLNRAAMPALTCEKRLEVVPGAGQCFEEPGARATMVHLAAAWLADRLGGTARPH